jgi:hypothetical protein
MSVCRAARLGLVALALGLTPGDRVGGDEPKKIATAPWTFDEAMEQLAFHPKDPYLQYVALQLGIREGRREEVVKALAPPPRPWLFGEGEGRQNQVDLFSTFTGALAVQESLQLDTMRGERPGRRQPEVGPGVPPVAPGGLKAVGGPAAPPKEIAPGAPPVVPPAPLGEPKPAPLPALPKQEAPAEPKATGPVPVEKLEGPTVESHPWAKMLGSKKPEVGLLAGCVPADFWFAEFRSPAKLNEVTGLSELWGGHIFTQALGEAKSQLTIERIKGQLGLAGIPPRALESLNVEGIALTGSDLFLGEGSDVTVLVHSRTVPALVRLVDGLKAGMKKEDGKHRDFAYVRQTSADGALNVYVATPHPDLHIRSNSLPAFRRVLDCVAGDKQAKRLGESPEFRYIRSLMPRGAAEEDGFVYLSDPFIRRLVGPQVKLTERRRVLVYNHLRMIGHACLMFRTEHGRAPKSLAELAEAKCAPGVFGQGELAHPDGGTYSLTADGMAGVCSKWGRADNLTPCLEHPVTTATPEEAVEYRAFVREYNEYWRTYFDPIAVRVRASDKQYRLETLILPLIDNTVYTTLAQFVGGPVVPLDSLPTPKRELGGVWLHLDKKPFIEALGPEAAAKAGDPKVAAGPREDRPGRAESPFVRARTSNELKQIGLAIHNYESAHGHLPADITDADGKPILSWRVAILPYLEQDHLYKQLRLNEPWDSEHNKKLTVAVPPNFRGPTGGPRSDGKTVYLAVTGKNTAFPQDGSKLKIADITDGTASTIIVVEANDEAAVPWAKPADLAADPKQPTKGLERPGRHSFTAMMGDGSIRSIDYMAPPTELAAAFTRNGGEPPGDLNPAPKQARPAGPKTPASLQNDLTQIALGMHNYHDAYGRFPPAAVPGPAGQAKLSWRVHLLPFIDQQDLYKEFKLDEPWSSEHNKKLVAKMPDIYKGLNARLNESGRTNVVVPVGADTIFRPDGAAVKIADVPDGTANTALILRVTDNAAVPWTKPDDLPVDPKDPFNGLNRQEGFPLALADGSVGRVRGGAEPATVAALFNRNGGESPVGDAVDRDRPNAVGGPLFPLDIFQGGGDWSALESAGFDLNKLRRFLRDGIGDQVGFHMHDASKLFDYDVSGAFGGAEVMGQRIPGPAMAGLGLAVQFLTGPSSVSIPVKDAKAVDEFLAELDKASLHARAARGETGWLREYLDFYRVPFPDPHVIRCHVVRFLGLKWRLYWGRIGDGLYIANRPFILHDLAAAHAAGKKPTGEKGHALFRLRPENWNEVLPGYKLGWAEGHRAACHANLSQLTNVSRGWNDRAVAPDGPLMKRVAQVYGARPFCPDGGTYTLSADGRTCSCSVHGTELEPRQPAGPTDGSATGRLFKSLAGVRATLTFEEDGLRAVVTIDRKE